MVVTVAMAILPIMFGAAPVVSVLRSSLIFASPIAAGMLFFDFRRRNLWPLYDNLRIPRAVLLVGSVVCIWILVVITT